MKPSPAEIFIHCNILPKKRKCFNFILNFPKFYGSIFMGFIHGKKFSNLILPLSISGIPDGREFMKKRTIFL